MPLLDFSHSSASLVDPMGTAEPPLPNAIMFFQADHFVQSAPFALALAAV